ncbi:MAG: hypothetical protein ACRCV9_15535 [Burkholderiaceae bacterium]
MTAAFTIGQEVVLTKNIYEEPSGDNPGGILGRRGDHVTIRSVKEAVVWPWTIKVSHADVTDGGGFMVSASEIRAKNQEAT